MKLKVIFALCALSVMVKGTWWAAAVQPVILSLGAILGALDLDVVNIQPWQIFKKDKEEEKDYGKEGDIDAGYAEAKKVIDESLSDPNKVDSFFDGLLKKG